MAKSKKKQPKMRCVIERPKWLNESQCRPEKCNRWTSSKALVVGRITSGLSVAFYQDFEVPACRWCIEQKSLRRSN